MTHQILWTLIESAWVTRHGHNNHLASIRAAYDLAYKAHDGQTRKYTGEPYITHPVALALDAIALGLTAHDVRVLLLHDTIEDTDHTIDTLARAVGTRVADDVWELTDQCHTGNRATRKTAEAARLAATSPDTQTRKLIDINNNTVSIVAHDPSFAAVYLTEKAVLADMLTGADPRVRQRTRRLITTSANQLELRKVLT